jgi:hypothetical protein
LLRCAVKLEAAVVMAAAAPAAVAAGELCRDAKLLLGGAALAAGTERESEVPRIRLLCIETMLPLYSLSAEASLCMYVMQWYALHSNK